MNDPSIAQSPDPYCVLCIRCNAAFNAMRAEWCQCALPMRSLQCSSCGECFCAARPSYRNGFWSRAPLSLRQNPRRFSPAHPAFQLVDPPQKSATAPMVVVVDDDESMRSLVGCFVEQLGYRVVVVSDAYEALVLAQHDDVRVLVTDALMPRMDGRELCRRLKESEKGANKKVILMTSLYTSQRLRSEAHTQFGVDAHLAKPLDLSALATVLRRLAPVFTNSERAVPTHMSAI